jgi:hypothetical protein
MGVAEALVKWYLPRRKKKYVRKPVPMLLPPPQIENGLDYRYKNCVVCSAYLGYGVVLVIVSINLLKTKRICFI